MRWTSIAGIIPKKIKALGLEKIFQFIKLKGDWDKVLCRAVGDRFIGKSRPVNFSNGVLVIDCLNSVWANELRLRESRLLEEIKKTGTPVKIEKISFIS